MIWLGLAVALLFLWLLVALLVALWLGPIISEHGKPPVGARSPQANRERER